MTQKKNLFILFIAILIVIFVGCKDSNKEIMEDIPTNTSDSDVILDKINQSIQKDPKNAQIYLHRANRYAELEAYDEAILDIKKSINLDSLNPIAYHQLSNVYMDYYRSREALQTMLKVVELFPERIPSLLKLSELQLILKKHDHAMITIDKIAKIDPVNAEAAFMLGLILMETGDEKAAINAFKKATEFDSQLTDAWLMLGEIYERKNNPLALNYYKNGLRSDTNNISAIHSYAYYIQNNGALDKAISLYKSIIAKDKTYQPAFLNIGILLLDQKKYENSIANFNILTSFAPNNFLAYYFKAINYEALGDLKLAKDNYQNCLNFNPEHKESKEALANLLKLNESK